MEEEGRWSSFPAAAGRLRAGDTQPRQGEAAVSAAGTTAAHEGEAAVGLIP